MRKEEGVGTLIILSNFLACQWNVEGAGGPGWWGDGKGFRLRSVFSRDDHLRLTGR